MSVKETTLTSELKTKTSQDAIVTSRSSYIFLLGSGIPTYTCMKTPASWEGATPTTITTQKGYFLYEITT